MHHACMIFITNKHGFCFDVLGGGLEARTNEKLPNCSEIKKVAGFLRLLVNARETGESQGKSVKTMILFTSRRSQGKVREKSSKLPQPRSAATHFDA